ncbi:unnamed protein product, partial [marine sediment metagenome]
KTLQKDEKIDGKNVQTGSDWFTVPRHKDGDVRTKQEMQNKIRGEMIEA